MMKTRIIVNMPYTYQVAQQTLGDRIWSLVLSRLMTKVGAEDPYRAFSAFPFATTTGEEANEKDYSALQGAGA